MQALLCLLMAAPPMHERLDRVVAGGLDCLGFFVLSEGLEAWAAAINPWAGIAAAGIIAVCLEPLHRWINDGGRQRQPRPAER